MLVDFYLWFQLISKMVYFCCQQCYVSLYIWLTLLLTQQDESTNRHEALLARQLYLACAHMRPVYTLIVVVELHGKNYLLSSSNRSHFLLVFQISPGNKQPLSALRHHPH